MSKSLDEEMNLFKQEVNDKVTDHFYKTTLQKYQFLIIFFGLHAVMMGIFALLIRTWLQANG